MVQDSVMQAVGVDALDGAGSVILVPREADVVVDPTVAAPRAGLGVGGAAVGASDAPAQVVRVIVVIVPRRVPRLPLGQAFLNSLPHLRLHQGRLGSVIPPLPKGKVSFVEFVGEQSLDGRGRPLAFANGVQVVADVGDGPALPVQVVSLGDNLPVNGMRNEVLRRLLLHVDNV